MEKLAWKVLGTGSAIIATGFADRAVHSIWRTATGEEPPSSPENPDTSWGDAVTWAILSGVGVAVVRLLVVRRAATYYRDSTGVLPPSMRPPKPKGEQKAGRQG